MALGNKGFAANLTSSGLALPETSRLPPRTTVLSTRENRLTELAAGNIVNRPQELVDPARCRIWDGHNRDYAALSAQNCADLIDSFKAQRRQEVAAIVRRVQGDPDHEYEVICGARRHWTVSWLRANSYPDLRFLVEIRELDDEEAFRVADLENRNRRDLSDYERARDYARALARYYAGHQQNMADRLNVSKSWLSRYLELSRLPREVLAAFGSPHAIGISHSASLAPILRHPERAAPLLAEAERLAAEQAAALKETGTLLSPAAVLGRLLAVVKTTDGGRTAGKRNEHVVRSSSSGNIVARANRATRGGGITITFPNPSRHERAVLLSAAEQAFDHFARAVPGKAGKTE